MRRLALGLLILAGLGLIPQGVKQIKPDAASPQAELPAPTMEQILAVEPLLTTSLSDARAEVPFFDDFNPERPVLLSLLPHDADGGFVLARAGFYEQDFQSFCLQAGVHVPSEGYGYIYAPIKGPMASAFRIVMVESARHPEIPRDDVQHLLWNMLGSLSPERFKSPAARKLLPAEQLAVFDRLSQDRLKRTREWAASTQKRQAELDKTGLAAKKAESDKRIKETAERMKEAQAKGDWQGLMREAQALQTDLQESIRMQTQWLQAFMNPNITPAEQERAFLREGDPKPGPGSRTIPR